MVEAAVLAVVFDPETWLESKSLRDGDGVGDLKEFVVQYAHEYGRLLAKRGLAIGRDDHFVETEGIGNGFEIDFECLPEDECHFALFGAVADTLHHEGIGSGLDVAEEVVTRGIGGDAVGSAFEEDGYAGDVLARFFVHHVSDDIGVGAGFIIPGCSPGCGEDREKEAAKRTEEEQCFPVNRLDVFHYEYRGKKNELSRRE